LGFLKIPPNFSFARFLGSETGSQSAEDRERAPLSCVAKKRSIGGDGAWREKKKKRRREVSQGRKWEAVGGLTAFYNWCGSWDSAAAHRRSFGSFRAC
jgi:hypothetical protein